MTSENAAAGTDLPDDASTVLHAIVGGTWLGGHGRLR
jgi:hypothetical protein